MMVRRSHSVYMPSELHQFTLRLRPKQALRHTSYYGGLGWPRRAGDRTYITLTRDEAIAS